LARKGLLLAFTALEPFVPVGAYVVVENTIVNGHPVWRNYGPGPAEAVSQILGEGRFVRDRSLERQPLSFNPGGFLRRTV
jgi:cephalosporin hydroxylase